MREPGSRVHHVTVSAIERDAALSPVHAVHERSLRIVLEVDTVHHMPMDGRDALTELPNGHHMHIRAASAHRYEP